MLDYAFIREFMLFINKSDTSTGPTEKEAINFAACYNISRRELGYIETLLFEADFITHKPICVEKRFVNLTPGILTAAGKNSLLTSKMILEVD
ncbi:hypothetical protein FC19_GL002108 [Liquorilactobacillus aquaticus DSM 21051]|uniref:Uncharacterized protein n=1 Tax=Liquorilactobacillus aquaticus DSM 21051 TaxID=1423725 RepID=A0A0R2CUD6_9LACO|nr:hypothetical protein [Liquorilactobacillus aquaticus]KRM95255.1 hypothetical protein FC19_GL002108 [Liquorilactobacillus aquaticus DSM 21051]